jgi:hypothetical protein
MYHIKKHNKKVFVYYRSRMCLCFIPDQLSSGSGLSFGYGSQAPANISTEKNPRLYVCMLFCICSYVDGDTRNMRTLKHKKTRQIKTLTTVPSLLITLLRLYTYIQHVTFVQNACVMFVSIKRTKTDSSRVLVCYAFVCVWTSPRFITVSAMI